MRKPAADKAVKAQLAAILSGLQERCPDIRWAAIVSVEGLEIVSTGDRNEKLSVMAGTMQALAEGVSSEATLGGCREMVVSGEGGTFIVLGVSEAQQDLVLAALGSPNLTLGMMLSSCNRTRVELRGFLRDSVPPV